MNYHSFYFILFCNCYIFLRISDTLPPGIQTVCANVGDFLSIFDASINLVMLSPIIRSSMVDFSTVNCVFSFSMLLL